MPRNRNPFQEIQEALAAQAEVQRQIAEAMRPLREFREALGIDEAQTPSVAPPRKLRNPPPIPPTTYPPGDSRWLKGKRSVSRITAAAYLGIKLDSVRKLIHSGHLERDGKHLVTTPSLRAYWHGKHTKKSGKKR
jgi:hypothetical protein